MRVGRLTRYAAAKEYILQRIVEALSVDERVVAAWLSGSVGRGDGDEWADYDLHVAIHDGAMESFLGDRLNLYASLGSVVLVQDDIPGQPDVSDRFHLVHFASPDGPIEVDWSFLPVSEARKPAGHQLLFEKQRVELEELPFLTPTERQAECRRWALFFWAMAPIAVRLCGRGDLPRAIGQTRLLSRALICLWRLLREDPGQAPWQPEANLPFEEELDAKLPRLGVEATPGLVLELVEALCTEAEKLQEDLRELTANVGTGIVKQTRALIETAQEAIGAGRFRPRKYR
jgi:predicted nucleotidyltransferase